MKERRNKTIEHFETVFLLLLIAAVILLVTFLYQSKQVNEVEMQRTAQLCQEYAQRDHEKELAPERWRWFKDQGIDPNTDFDWYGSCIAHSTKAVAR